MNKRTILLFAALAILPATSAFARGRVVVFAGPRFGAYGFYGPYWGPYGWAAYPGPFYGTPNAGEVKLDTHLKETEVFINGAYAGTAGKLKSMYLKPGSYNLELRAPGRQPFAEKVYVVAGKTIKLTPDLHN